MLLVMTSVPNEDIGVVTNFWMLRGWLFKDNLALDFSHILSIRPLIPQWSLDDR